MDGPTFMDTPARQSVIGAAILLRGHLAPNSARPSGDAWAAIETTLAISLRLLDKHLPRTSGVRR